MSYTTQDYLPKDDITHSGLAPPTSIINQACLQPMLVEAVPQLRIPSFQVFLVCVKLTKASLHTASNGDVMNHDHFRVNKTSVGHGNFVRLLKLVNVFHQHAQLELSFPLLPKPQMHLDLM